MAVSFPSLSCGPVDLEVLQTLSGPQLAALYTELTAKAITKFRDRATGVARVKPALEAKLKEIATPPAEKPAVLARAAKKRKPFNYPARAEQGNWRPNTKRAALIAALSRPEGATFEECQEAAGWVGKEGYKITYESIYLLHVYLGFGLREGEDGRIRLTVQATEGRSTDENRDSVRGAGDGDRRDGDRVCAGGQGGDAGGGREVGDHACGGGAGVRAAAGPEGARFGGGHRRAERVSRDAPAKGKGRGQPGLTPGLVESSCLDRIVFLAKATGRDDLDDVVLEAVRFYDRAVCARLDGGSILIRGKTGVLENVTP